MAWTLTHDGTTEPLATWGVSGLVRSLHSFAVDTVRFAVPGDALSASPFAFGDTITISNDGTTWFTGRVTGITHEASGSEERHRIEVSGPWWYLENLVFQQTTKVFAGWSGTPGEDPILSDVYSSHVFLNQAADGSLQGTQATMAEVLAWAVAQGASLGYTESTFPSMDIPIREEKDITCADAIRRQISYMDAVSWFDYTTTPPTLYIKRRTDLTPASLALDGTDGVRAVGIVKRDDLKVPYVHIKFEKAYEDTYGTYLQITDQYYPSPIPAEKFGALIATVVLSSATSMSQYIETRTIDPTNLDFWFEVRPELANDQEYRDLAFVLDQNGDVQETREGSMPYYIYDGAYATWMPGAVEDETISVLVSYTQTQKLGGQNTTANVARQQTITVRLKATDIETGTYSMLTRAGESPDDFPTLAQDIYTDLNADQYDGTVTVSESELSGTVSMGNSLNLTGGVAAWASMAAAVQSVTEFVDSGETEITIGPNRMLSAGQLVDLLRVNRTRQLNNAAMRYNAQMSGAADLPRSFARENSTNAIPLLETAMVSGPEQSPRQSVQISGKDGLASDGASVRIMAISSNGEPGAPTESDTAGKILLELVRAGGHTLSIREIAICVGDGEGGWLTKYTRGLFCDPYDVAETLNPIE